MTINFFLNLLYNVCTYIFKGKIASLIGVESGHAMSSSMGVLRNLYSVGARWDLLLYSFSVIKAKLQIYDFNPSM